MKVDQNPDQCVVGVNWGNGEAGVISCCLVYHSVTTYVLSVHNPGLMGHLESLRPLLTRQEGERATCTCRSKPATGS